VLADGELIQRKVVLDVTIGTDGRSSAASYVRGPEEFKDAAIQCVKQRNFGPHVFAGVATRMKTCIRVDSRR